MYNIAIGHGAGDSVTTGKFNTIIGPLAGDSLQDDDHNVMIGYASGTAAQSDNNVFVGGSSGANVSTGAGNVCIGSSAGNSTVLLTTGGSNVIIGLNARTVANSTDNSIVIGEAVTGVGSNNFTFGTGTTDSNIAHGATTITAPSDERYKENIANSSAGLSFINDLRPVTFQWKKEKDVPSDHRAYVADSDKRVMNSNGETNHGFIAQEVKTAIDNHAELKDGFDMWSEEVADGEGGRQRVAPAALIPMLVKAIQELSAEIETLKSGG